MKGFLCVLAFLATPVSSLPPEITALSLIQTAVNRVGSRVKPGAGTVQCGGATEAGSTAWVQYATDGIYVDVDTSKCGFMQTPEYLSSLGGKSSHWTSTGGSEIYLPTPTGFRVYIHKKSATPAYANDRLWHINWIGSGSASKQPAT